MKNRNEGTFPHFHKLRVAICLPSSSPLAALAVKTLFVSTAIYRITSVMSLIMIHVSFSAKQHNTFICLMSKYVQLNENSICVPKIYLLTVLHGTSLHVSILSLYFSHKTCVFVTHILIGWSYPWLHPIISLMWPRNSGLHCHGWKGEEVDHNR